MVTVRFTNGAEIKCVVDTGFNGSLFLPIDFIKQNDFSLIGEETFHSVGQSEPHVAEVFSAKIIWLSEELDVIIIASEHGSSLIGAGMLLESRLEIDYVASTVVIEKVSE